MWPNDTVRVSWGRERLGFRQTRLPGVEHVKAKWKREGYARLPNQKRC